MRWLGDPPCTTMEVFGDDLAEDRLELRGPALSARFQGGVHLLGGGLVTRFALPLLRLPGPGKAVALAFLGVGAGLSALGGTKLLARTTLVAERGKGITCWWKVPPRRARQRVFKTRDIARLEVRREQLAPGQVRAGDASLRRGWDDGDRVRLGWELFVVTRERESVALELFYSHDAAEDRRHGLSRVLGLAAPTFRRAEPDW